MKRLITILLSFIGCVSLYGQAVPMVVAGKMHVSGPMYSVGQVNVYAKTAATVDTGKVDIVSDIAGVTASLTADTIILYSNDNSDGLLRNAATVQGATVNRKVTVRKTFTENKWTYLSLPFPVASADVTTGGKPLVGGDPSGTYWTFQFDAKWTSDSIKLDAWKELTYANGFEKGVGYQGKG